MIIQKTFILAIFLLICFLYSLKNRHCKDKDWTFTDKLLRHESKLMSLLYCKAFI